MKKVLKDMGSVFFEILLLPLLIIVQFFSYDYFITQEGPIKILFLSLIAVFSLIILFKQFSYYVLKNKFKRICENKKILLIPTKEEYGSKVEGYVIFDYGYRLDVVESSAGAQLLYKIEEDFGDIDVNKVTIGKNN